MSVQRRSKQLAGDRQKQGAGGQAGRTHGALSPGDRGSTCATGVVRVNSGRPGRSACVFKIPWAALWEQTRGSGGGAAGSSLPRAALQTSSVDGVCFLSSRGQERRDTLFDLESLS